MVQRSVILKMQIAICDDEKIVREMLAGRVLRLYPDADILCYGSGRELLEADATTDAAPDILFLDIQMPGMDGMETARELRKKNRRAVLIFVTAIEDYVFQAFDVGAFHYIVKPFTDERFEEVLRNAVGQYELLHDKMTHVSEKRMQEMHMPEKSARLKEAEKCFMVKKGGAAMKIPLSDIIYAEVFNRKVTIHTMDEDIEYYGKLADLEKQAGDGFFRTHRAYLVNFSYVVKYNAASVWLKKGSALMAKQNYHEFVKRYLKYNQR